MHTLEKFGITLPIFQAPIGSVASAELAAAVSNAAAVGHVSGTWRTPQETKELLRNVGRLTTKPFGINFVLDFPIEAQLEAALEERVRIVSFFWGSAARFVRKVKDAGAVVIQVVGSVREAVSAAEAGAHLIVAQGHEAGGHVCGTLGLMALLPQVVDAVHPLPVVGGGGISDARGVAAALALGAAGVWVGTRFLATHEANIHPHYRNRVVAASGDDTLYSNAFDVGWPNAPHRTLRNETTALWERARAFRTAPPRADDIVTHRADGFPIPRYYFGSPTLDVHGDVDDMALYAGEAVGLVRTIDSAAAVVADLARGLNV